MRLLPLTGLLLAAPVALAVLPAATAAEPAPAPRVVVADIDSGINPYHVKFRGTSVTQDVLDEFGIGPGQIIDLTKSGTVANAVKIDFAGVERGKPYWFRGTNVIGISFDTTGTPIFPDAGDEHGTGTASSVLDANPEAVVVMVEGTANAAAEDWAFSHPAVDVVTTSYGFPGSPPLGTHLEGSYDGVVKNGQMHFGASDNSPALSPFDGTSGPWWSIGVAGFHEGSGEGRETLSGNVIDIVSDFTQTIPYCVDCRTGTRSVSGTSFATPRSAGVASKIILDARRAAGHSGGIRTVGGTKALVDGAKAVTTWDVRRAIEEAASVPPTAAYKATTALINDGGSLPVVEQAAYAQTGWGLVNPAIVPAATAQLNGAAPRKDSATCRFNLAQFDARVAYWDNAALFSDSDGGSAAYRRCTV